MTAAEQIQQLMQELGPASEAIATVAQEPDGTSWAVELEDELVVSIEFDSERNRLAVSTAMPAPPADRRLETCEALLTYNLLWQGTPPIRMAMDQPGGEIVQIAEIPAGDLDVSTLEQTILQFAQVARLWAAAIAAGCTTPIEEPTLDRFGAAIRV